MSWRKFDVLFRGAAAATWMVIVLTCDYGYAQLIDRAGAEKIMRELMPPNSRCAQTPSETLSYCRYDTANTPDVVLEASFGDDGPAFSLTYDIGNIEGRQFVNMMRLYFLRVGVPKLVLDKCIARLKSQSSEVVAASLRIKCRYTDFADRIGYEIFVERSNKSQPVVGLGVPH